MLFFATARLRAMVPPYRRRYSLSAATGGVVTVCAWLATMCAAHGAAAEPVTSIRVEERDDLTVAVTVEVSGAPTFQVFRIPGRDAFAVELPGSDLRDANRALAQDKIVLQRAIVDPGREPPRVMVEFFDEVDYDARSEKGRLEVIFRPLSGHAALRKAHELRFAQAESRRQTEDALAETRRVLAKERAAVKQVALELTDLKSSVAAVAKTRASLEQAVAEEQDALSAAKSQNDDLKRATARLEQDRATLGRELEALRKENVAEQGKLDEKRREEKVAQAKLEQVLRDLRSVEGKRATLDEKVAELARTAEARGQESDRASAQQRELANQLAALNKERADQTAALAAAKAEAARVQRALDEQRRALATLVQQASEEDARREAAKRERVTLSAELEALTQQVKAGRASLAAQAHEEAEARARRTEARATTSPAQAIPMADQCAKGDAERQRIADAARRRTAEEERQLKELQTQVASAEEQLRVVQLETARANGTLRSTQQALEQTEQQRQRVAREVTQEELKLAQLTDKLARVSRQQSRESVTRAPTPSARLELASATPTESFGFGGKSVDLEPAPAAKNRYLPDDGYGGEDDVIGDLSHITVQRTQGTGSRVGVLVEGGARYAVRRPSAREVVLTLFATRAANLEVRRILDARDLRTSVLRVLPHVEEGSRDVVELTVELREATSVRVAQDGSMLWLHIGG